MTSSSGRRCAAAGPGFHGPDAGMGAEVSVAADAVELLTSKPVLGGSVTVPPGEVVVVREPRTR